MQDKMLKMLEKIWPLSERETGEFTAMKVGPMKFFVQQYEAEGLGHVCVMDGKAMFGLMKMQTIVVNLLEKDAPLFSYDRIHAMGNDTLLLEIYETRLAPGERTALDEVVKAYDFLPAVPAEKAWYEDIKWASSVKKKGKKAETPKFDEMTEAYFARFLKLCQESPECDRTEKKRAAAVYTEGLLNHGGPSTDQFMKVFGAEKTRQFFERVMFGTGE